MGIELVATAGTAQEGWGMHTAPSTVATPEPHMEAAGSVSCIGSGAIRPDLTACVRRSRELLSSLGRR